MRKILFVVIVIASALINAYGQQTITTADLAADLKKLIELNSHIPGLVDVSSKEAVNISANATAAQVISITRPYVSSNTLNSKSVCLHFLNEALIKKSVSQQQKETIVEMICKNYLSEKELYKVHYLLNLTSKDFNTRSKKYIAAILNDAPAFNNNVAYRLLALVQVKKSIPKLWNVLNDKTIGEIGEENRLDILASLARMGEKHAAVLLCNYYDSIRMKNGYKATLMAKYLAFSMDQKVLECLVSDYKKMDLEFTYRDGDSGYTPAQVLGGAITTMLKDYPYKKGEYNIDTQQLLDWLNKTMLYAVTGK